MTGGLLVDSGPLVAILTRGAVERDWCIEIWDRLEPPALTCEAVLTEVCFLLNRDGYDTDPLLQMIARSIIRIDLHVDAQLADLRALMKRYRNLPMSLADACLVRLAEINPGHSVFTLDSHFRIYRKHGNRVIPLLMPAV